MATSSIIQEISRFTTPGVELKASDDLNTIPLGLYRSENSALPTNAPTGAYNGWCACMRVRGTDRIQIWISINVSKIYFRTGNGNPITWSVWKEIATA